MEFYHVSQNIYEDSILYLHYKNYLNINSFYLYSSILNLISYTFIYSNSLKEINCHILSIYFQNVNSNNYRSN